MLWANKLECLPWQALNNIVYVGGGDTDNTKDFTYFTYNDFTYYIYRCNISYNRLYLWLSLLVKL
jgi:hypothetical protein